MNTTPALLLPSSPRPSGGGIAGLRVLGQSEFVRFRAVQPDTRVPITIGRSPEWDICIPDDSISHYHCKITRSMDGSYVLHDEGSKNGVHMSAQGPDGEYCRVGWEAIRLGVYIRLGDVTLVPVDEHGESPITAQRHSEFMRIACAVYGTASQIWRHTGLPKKLFRKLLTRLRGSQSRKEQR